MKPRPRRIQLVIDGDDGKSLGSVLFSKKEADRYYTPETGWTELSLRRAKLAFEAWRTELLHHEDDPHSHPMNKDWDELNYGEQVAWRESVHAVTRDVSPLRRD